MGVVVACATCGTEPRQNARFCDGCGSAITSSSQVAEYKQVTVLFADVVHSMDIAKAVGPERLREIMAGLVDRATTVVGRYGGTVDKFTGDGIMAVFGAPVALEDHALRACRAALDIHTAIRDLAQEVSGRDGVELQLRIGLNSGQVIAGEIGSGGTGYTAIGEQVGLAQRMESVAQPGGVMLSASTADLVETVASLGDPELVHIKGTDHPVAAQQLMGLSDRDRPVAGAESALVGRGWEMAAVQGLLQRSIDGHGAVVTMVGSPGIGKSRLVREVTALAEARGVEVFSAYCESHTTQVPFHAVARLLRAVTGVGGLDGPTARAQVRARTPDADPEDLLLFEDLLGIADPEAELPKIDPDARRRRLTALVNTASLARKSPAVYVIEDAHWIDEVSESMLGGFLTVIPQTPSLVLVTYRPEYRGALSQVQGAQTIALAPLSDQETGALVAELVGRDPSVAGLATSIVERSAGNPFFAHEIVRDLSERGVLQGQTGEYVSTADVAEVSLPATVQATIAARIDRLDPALKRTLSAAAVIGAKVSRDLLEILGVEPALEDLVTGQFLDQITFGRNPQYAFHHPLIRTVAYEAQLRSDRAELHRRVAATIESRDPAAVEHNAAVIAEHLEAAGDLHAAYGWHMRAASWATNRDINAARLSWERAQQIADALPVEDPARTAMRIAPRTMLCGSAYRVNEDIAGDRFVELRDLCSEAGDKPSLAIAMAGLVINEVLQGRVRQASQLASDAMALIESIGDPTLTVGLSYAPIFGKLAAGDFADGLRWSQRAIDLADGDPSKGNFLFASPLALVLATRASAGYYLGCSGWRDDMDRALATARSGGHADIITAVVATVYLAIPMGVLKPVDAAVRDVEAALRIAERSSDDMALAGAQMTLGAVLVHRPTAAERDRGQMLLAEAKEMYLGQKDGGPPHPRRRLRYLGTLPGIELYLARERVRHGDRDEAIPLMRAAVDDLVRQGQLLGAGIVATGVLVETLLDGGTDADVAEAEAAIERLAAAPTDEGLALRDIWLLRLRALLAQAHGDDTAYRGYRDRYRKMANDLGFEGHMKWAEEMT